MKKRIKFKGKLKSYMLWPLYLSIVWLCIDIPLVLYDTKSGVVLLAFTFLYFILVMLLFWRSRKVIANEVINFATQYSSVQKKLLNEFEIPYILLDNSAKILWMNEASCELSGLDKKYRKSVTTIFPTITREFLSKTQDSESITIERDERVYRIAFRRIYFQSIAQESEILEYNSEEDFLTAMYIFDETQLNNYKNEIQRQKLVSSLVYIDNYDEALDSIEDVKRSLLVALIDRRVNQ